MKKNNKFEKGIMFNYISLAVMAASGLIFNLIILSFYDESALGVFNEIYAWYVVLSQVAAFGIHTSVLSYASVKNSNDSDGDNVFSAIFASAVVSVIVIFIGEFVLSSVIIHSNFSYGMKIAMPGLAFFSFNKILINYVNAKSEMTVYAVLQSLRYVLMFASLVILSLFHVEVYWLASSFTIAETLLFIISTIYICNMTGGFYGKPKKCWILRHLIFGSKVFPANMVIEMNPKVDIICLSLILKDDYLIGIYSFAILFSDGLYQAYVVLRRSINPEIAEAQAKDILQDKIHELYNRFHKVLQLFMPLLAILALCGYKILCIMTGTDNSVSSLVVVAVIEFSIVITGRSILFGNVFSQSKYPSYESIVNICSIVSNFLFNIVFISIFGMLGAAFGTAISYLMFAFMQRHYLKRIGLQLK